MKRNMEIDIYKLDWLPIDGYPGYEVATCGLICKKKKNGEREILVPYKDRRAKDGKNYVTLWKNYAPQKVWTIDIFKTAFYSKKKDEEKPKSPDNGKQRKRTRIPELPKDKFKELVDRYDPNEMSASAYMKKLREQGYRFTSAHLGAELSKKKKSMNNGLF